MRQQNQGKFLRRPRQLRITRGLPSICKWVGRGSNPLLRFCRIDIRRVQNGGDQSMRLGVTLVVRRIALEELPG
jgi:hypothetical protein